MNIFVTSPLVSRCAQDLDDLRLRKMIVETAQMAATALRVKYGIETQYKSTHTNHPCNKWARETDVNLNWLLGLGISMCAEYRYRFGKVHKTQAVINDQMIAFYANPGINLAGEQTPFQNSARNSVFDFTGIPVPYSYKAYLIAKWTVDKKEPKWTRRGPPSWAKVTWQGSKTGVQ